jgi:hypothetical protein
MPACCGGVPFEWWRRRRSAGQLIDVLPCGRMRCADILHVHVCGLRARAYAALQPVLSPHRLPTGVPAYLLPNHWGLVRHCVRFGMKFV